MIVQAVLKKNEGIHCTVVILRDYNQGAVPGKVHLQHTPIICILCSELLNVAELLSVEPQPYTVVALAAVAGYR